MKLKRILSNRILNILILLIIGFMLVRVLVIGAKHIDVKTIGTIMTGGASIKYD